ncbi:MAG TPA: hypothetical protein VN853_18745 [Polyangia bacterium]|nr:hypothetical protein [Polyangia bacterium]
MTERSKAGALEGFPHPPPKDSTGRSPVPSTRRGSRTPDPAEAAAALAQPALAPRRPMARATQVALFEREVRERLSRTALELVLSRAEVISEGQRNVRNGRDAYFGSTMLTIDLPSLELLLRDTCDAGTARRLAALLETDAQAGAHVEALAAREAERVAGAKPKAVRTHVTIRAQAARVFIDIDVEATF